MNGAIGETRRREAVRRVLEGRAFRPARPSAEARAPANIALVKYWGKRDEDLHLPVTASLSVSLGPLGTRTRISAAARDAMTLNGVALRSEDPIAVRLFRFVDLFRSPGDPALEIESDNTVPTGAGLASSASGFAALVRALDAWCGWDLPSSALSILARLGSGSACRSVFDGFVEWRAGTRADGMDSLAEPRAERWPGLRISAVIVEAGPKPVGSGEAMRRTMATSPLYAAWPDMVARDLGEVRSAIASRDIERLGRTAERNATAMHETMQAARPAIRYETAATRACLEKVRTLRSDGRAVYATMDAGPNVKLIHEARDDAAVAAVFPSMVTVRPFDPAAV